MASPNSGHATRSPPSNAPREYAKAEATQQKAGITTERGQAAKAAGPGTAPVQVAERLQAHGTCGHSTTASQAISAKKKFK